MNSKLGVNKTTWKDIKMSLGNRSFCFLEICWLHLEVKTEMKSPTKTSLEPLKIEESLAVVTNLTESFCMKTDKILAFLTVLILKT